MLYRRLKFRVSNMTQIPDNPLSLDSLDIYLCINGVHLVRDCGLLSEEHDKHAKDLLDRLESCVKKEELDVREKENNEK